ncbi:hypothetical protein GCK32_002856 [Trichostrongylus colubriformis]|uniref:G protein-coupled receptor n=1 Tax=Trichostrongylus colubriformis TaxID=6319 RepID=A0AAN8IAP8_TRICO
MIQSTLDMWHHVLYSLECVFNVLFILAVSLLFYICATQKNYHVNFRVSLMLIGFGYLICELGQLSLAVSRMCCIGLDNAPIVEKFTMWKFSGMNVHMFAWTVLIIERTIATVFVGVYEAEFRCEFIPAAICGLVLLLAALVGYVKVSAPVGGMDMYILGLQILVTTLSLAACILILLVNKSSYRKRHSSQMHLNNRYQIDENIRAGRYLLPVVFNEFLVKFATSLLSTYSIFFTSIPVGYDTTHLSHAYHLIFAYQRLFFAISLTVRSEKFKLLMKRNTRIDRIVERQAVARSSYFDQLKHMW